jgi:uncharacterized protein
MGDAGYLLWVIGIFARERYINLTSFRKDGSEASTPVWVVSDDGARLLVWTGAQTWKAKRIRRNPRVLVARSTIRGRERGDRVEGRARVLEDVDLKPLIRKKYGWQMRLLELASRAEDASVAIEIVDV